MSFDFSFLSSDPLLYFLAHSTVFVVSIAAVFFTFGLAFGWFTWARYKSQRRELLSECELLKDEIASLKRKLTEQTARASALAEASLFAGPQRHDADTGTDSQGHSPLSTEAEESSRTPESQMGILGEQSHGHPPGAGVAAQHMPDPALEPPAPGAGIRLMSDPHLGLIYPSRPALIDELSQIKGVAHLIEGRLHGLGVYTYKQIALWNDENIREFSNLLAFKDRIHREQWIEQAQDLHFQKYGEQL